MPLFEYYFQRIHKVTSLVHIVGVGQYWIKTYPDCYYSGRTIYRLDPPAPKNYKQPRRYKTEHWYAYVEINQAEGALQEVFKLLSSPQFSTSTNSKGEDIPPVPLPIKRPVGRPKKIITPLRQIIICHDLQLIATLQGN